MNINRICVFCGSSSGRSASYAEAATTLGHHLGAIGIGLVYGGARVGLMGLLADAALAAGGEVVGFIPQALVDHEVAHESLTELHVVASMHERKSRMADLSDAFIALPGGFGTIEELCEILTWAQLGLHSKPVGVLNVDGYYDPLLAFFDNVFSEKFIRPEHRSLVIEGRTPQNLLESFAAYQSPRVKKWIDPTES